MPRQITCSFCEKMIRPGTGMDYIRNDATIMHFCSNKCKINMLELKRKPRKTKWVIKKQPA